MFTYLHVCLPTSLSLPGNKEKETNQIAIRLRKLGEVQPLDLTTLLSTLQHSITDNIELNQISQFVPKPAPTTPAPADSE